MAGPLLPSPDHDVHIIIWNEVGGWAHEDLKCANMLTKICVQFWGGVVNKPNKNLSWKCVYLSLVRHLSAS